MLKNFYIVETVIEHHSANEAVPEYVIAKCYLSSDLDYYTTVSVHTQAWAVDERDGAERSFDAMMTILLARVQFALTNMGYVFGPDDSLNLTDDGEVDTTAELATWVDAHADLFVNA